MLWCSPRLPLALESEYEPVGVTNRPNVLVLMGDEHQARALGCAGHPIAQTPHLDALAARGTRFTRAWTPSPICVPARAAFATGRYVHEVGAWDSAQAWSGEPEGWTHRLRADGYDVVSFGKLHHRSGADDDGFSHRVLPMFIAGGVGWLQGLPRREPLPYDEGAELAGDVGSGETTYTRYDRRVTEAATAWLEDRAVADDKPWCAFVSLVAPHYPLSAPHDFTAMYPIEDVPPPEIRPVDDPHPAVAAMRSFFDYGRWFDRELTQRGRQAYFALTSWLDHNVGQVLASLERAGQLDNTLVIYTSDHGEMAGNRGLWCKSFMYRDSVDVPLIMAGPGVAPGATCDTEVNLVDVAATVEDAAGLASAGESLRLIAAQPTDEDRVGFSEYHDGGSITGSFAVRRGQWKYVEHVDYAPQLYDTGSDPDELADLGASAAHATVRSEMAAALRDIVDPDGANANAFASQAVLLDEHGGRDGVARAFRFNHTPIPTDATSSGDSGDGG